MEPIPPQRRTPIERSSEVRCTTGGKEPSSRTRLKFGLDLMKRGSYQVEMSDEGLMTEDLEACLRVVIEAAAGCNLPADEVLAWCSAMLKSDRIGIIAREPLEALRRHETRLGLLFG